MLTSTKSEDADGEPDIDRKPTLFSHFILKSWSFVSPKTEFKSRADSCSDSINSCQNSGRRPQPPHSRAWTKGVVVCSWIMAVVLCINVLLTTIAAGIAYSKNGEKDPSFAALYKGKCNLAKGWSRGLHLAINVLSTVLLGASNYCMQCLASPSRAEADEAHSRGTWVSIGIPNIPDLMWRPRGKRQVLGWVLLVASLPVHLIYNSAVFFVYGPTEYTAVTAPPGPMKGNGTVLWNECLETNLPMSKAALAAEMSRSDLQMLSNKECFDTFAQDFVSGQRMVLLVTNDPMPTGEPVVVMGTGNSGDISRVERSNYMWMCGGSSKCSKNLASRKLHGDKWTVEPVSWTVSDVHVQIATSDGLQNMSALSSRNTTYRSDLERLSEMLDKHAGEDEVQAALDDPNRWENALFPDSVTILSHGPACGFQDGVPIEGDPIERQQYYIDHCLTIPKDESCQLIFSPPICLIVIGCNLMKLLCTLFTRRDDRDEVLLTTGDAVASYLTYPDRTTEGSCLLSKPLIGKGDQGWHKRPKKHRKKSETPGMSTGSKRPPKLEPRKRWLEAASTRRWVLKIYITLALVGGGIYILTLGLAGFDTPSPEPLWSAGLGEASQSTIVAGLRLEPDASTSHIFGMALLPNVPQLLVSAGYFMFNSLLTIMVSAAEYNSYAIERKPLRVSWPRGAQRSTYYLSLPYKYNISLLAISALLHWLVSQSLFFVQIVPSDINGVENSEHKVITCAYSPVGLSLQLSSASQFFSDSCSLDCAA